MSPTATFVVSADPQYGTIDPAPGVYEIAEGDSYSFTAIPAEGYRFSNWTVNILGQTMEYSMNPYVGTVLGFLVGTMITVHANFVPDNVDPVADSCILVISVDDATKGYTEPGVGRHAYALNDEIHLEAFANEGYRFDKWHFHVAAGFLADTFMTVNPFVLGSVNELMLGQVIYITAIFADEASVGDVAAETFQVYTRDGVIVVRSEEHQHIDIFDVMGRRHFSADATATEQRFRPNSAGIYMVKVGNRPARRVFVK